MSPEAYNDNLFKKYVEAGAFVGELALRFDMSMPEVKARLKGMEAPPCDSDILLDQLGKVRNRSCLQELLNMVPRRTYSLHSRGDEAFFVPLTVLAETEQISLGFPRSTKPIRDRFDKCNIPHSSVSIQIDEGESIRVGTVYFTLSRFKLEAQKAIKNLPKKNRRGNKGRYTERRNFLQAHEDLLPLLKSDQAWILRQRLNGLSYREVAESDDKGRSNTIFKALGYRAHVALEALVRERR